jgi:predicted nucleic acid-binding protein
MRILVDTCVWSEALRRITGEGSDVSRELQDLILEHRVEIIGPIRQELLSGLREDNQFEKLEKHLEAFPDITLEAADHIMAAQYFNKCRARGIQGSNTDFLICAVAVRREIAIYPTDGDFQQFCKVSPNRTARNEEI